MGTLLRAFDQLLSPDVPFGRVAKPQNSYRAVGMTWGHHLVRMVDEGLRRLHLAYESLERQKSSYAARPCRYGRNDTVPGVFAG